MIIHPSLTDYDVRLLIRNNKINYAGNSKLKIFGLLACPSGKRMKKVNRVFFKSEQEARHYGYRPSGNCLPAQFKEWKNGSFQSGNL